MKGLMIMQKSEKEYLTKRLVELEDQALKLRLALIKTQKEAEKIRKKLAQEG